MPGPTDPTRRVPPAGVANAQEAPASQPAGGAAPAPSDADATRFLDQFEANYNGVSFESWKRFINVPPDLRSWLTERMIEAKNTLNFLSQLQVEELTPEMKGQLTGIYERLKDIVDDLQSPLFDNGSLSHLGLERLQNRLFRSGRTTALRVNINMTDANTLDQRLGTAFKHAVLWWLQNEFGIRHVSQNPEGTSFLAINVSPDEISCGFRRFADEIKRRLRRNEIQERYGFDPALLSKFAPVATAMFMDLSTEGLAVSETLNTGNRPMILDLQNKIITLIEDAQRLLAVGTTLIEKEGPEKFGITAMFGGMNVFSAANLPMTPQMTGYERLQMGLRIGVGYVPASQYQSPMDELAAIFPMAPGKLAFHPRFAHNYGMVYALAMERLKDAVAQIQSAQGYTQTEAGLIALQDAVQWLSYIFALGELARSNSRNRLFTKWIQEVELQDGTKLLEYYFLEDVARIREPKVHLMMVELDYFKSFSNMYPVDETDSNFWGVFDQFVWVAKARGIDPPVMTQVAGDLVGVVIPTIDQLGKSVDLADFIRHVQRRIAGVYGNKPFQVYMKVEVPNGHGIRTERWPAWIVGDQIVPSLTQPPGSKPYLLALSASIIGTTMATPRSILERGPFIRRIDDMADRMDELKKRSSPRKGQFEIISYDQTEMRTTPSVTGYFVPPETSSHEAELVSFIARIDEELTEIWGEPWSTLTGDVRRNFVVHLIRMLRTRRGRQILDNNVAQQVFRQIGHPMPRIPQAQILLAPVLPRVGVTL